MKTKIKLTLLLIFTLVVIAPIATFAQTTVTAEVIKSYFGSISSMVALTLIVTAFFKSKNLKGFGLQFVSWMISIVLAIIGYYLHLGMFESLTLGWSIIVGFFTSLAANMVADTPLIQSIYELIHGNS